MTGVPFVFEPLETRGELVTAAPSAVDRASELVAEARAHAAEIEAAAHEQGFATGREEGLAAAEEEYEATRAALGSVLQGLEEARDEVVARVEREAVELALAVAEKVLGAAIAVDPGLVCGLVAGALRRATEHDRLVLELNPDDVELVRDWLAAGGASSAGRLELRSERRVDRGGCVVRTPEGEIDGRVREQLARAREIIQETLAAEER